MEAFEQAIILDVLSIALVAFVLGLAVHGLLRLRNPELGWGALGNVWTQPFGRIDLLVVGVIVALIYWWLLVTDVSPGEAVQSEAEMSVEAAWLSAVFLLFLFTALIFFLGFVRGRNLPETFGLARLSPLRIAGIASVAMLIAFPVAYLVTEGANLLLFKDTLGEFDTQEVVQLFANSDDLRLKLVLIMSTCLIAPVVEETFFRGYFYPVVKRFTDRSFSALFTSTIFAVIHMNVLSFAPLWALAICFTVAYEVTGCLWVPIAMHAIFNTVNVTLILTFPDLL